MSDKIKVTCEVPAPPDVKESIAMWEWERAASEAVLEACAVRAPAEPEYEANELVRFYLVTHGEALVGVDDLGGEWCIQSVGERVIDEWDDDFVPNGTFVEYMCVQLHPRLTVRPVVSGESWVADDHDSVPGVAPRCWKCDIEGNPCDQQGNPLTADLPEGWTRDDKWILAPIERNSDGACVRIRNESRWYLLPDQVAGGYRCVGFLKAKDVAESRRKHTWIEDHMAHRTRSYSILGNWRATHAVLVKEGGGGVR